MQTDADHPMLIVVLIVNLLLALLCWWAIWQVWRLRQQLAKFTEQLIWAEIQASQLRLPSLALQQRLQQLQSQYQQTCLRLQQARQLLGLLGLGQQIWKQARNPTRNPTQNSTGHLSRNQRRGRA